MLAFVVPSFDPPTGGNVYNRRMLAALAVVGVRATVLDPDQACSGPASTGPRTVVVDTLFLDRLPELRATSPSSTRLHLLAHFLPSSLEGDGPLTPAERAALGCVDGCIATGRYLAETLRAREPVCPVALVEPASETEELPAVDRSQRPGLHAVMVANPSPSKGVLALLDALASRLDPADAIDLAIVGSDAVDPDYTRACRQRAAEHDGLRRRVRFTGSLCHAATLASIAAADVLVSASRMESYGMALAEARALGVPILARTGGNVPYHVDPSAGGELVTTDAALATALIHLAREPAEQARRRALAASARPAPRRWIDAARELLNAIEDRATTTASERTTPE